MFRRVGSKSWLGRLGIILLILSLGRVPLPIPAFHGPDHSGSSDPLCLGQDDCRPDRQEGASGPRKSVRWHWVILNASALCGLPSAIGSEAAECHPDWSSCEHDPSPQFLVTAKSRRIVNPFTLSLLGDLSALAAGRPRALARPVPAPTARNFVATYPHRTSISSLLQRWTC